jgi:hypothetical protein
MGMEVARLDPSELGRRVLEALGLDPDVIGLDSPTATAASVRRAASFLCPTPPGVLGREVDEALTGLTGVPSEEGRAAIDAVVDSLVALGDLIELPLGDPGSRSRRHLFLGPPSYVSRVSSCILLGVRPEGAPIVSGCLLERVECHGHLRLVRRRDESEDLEDSLAGEDLIELSAEQWLRAPRRASPEEVIDNYVTRLDGAGRAGEIEGIRVIDPASDVTYYRGRWRELKASDGGRFVARRPQAYGANLWCFAEVLAGKVEKLIDLPVLSSAGRGADEAWRLQAALDRVSGCPQRLRIRRGVPEGPVLDLFSPPPGWSRRRLELVGIPVERSRGALFSYSLHDGEVDEEARFLTEMMWLAGEEATGGEHG